MIRIVRTSLIASVLGLTTVSSVAAHPAVSGDGVRRWNELAFGAVRARAAVDAAAARAYAMLNAAMYDAVWGIHRHHGGSGGRGAALVPHEGPAHGDTRAAAAQAAHDVLIALFPEQSAALDGELALELGEPTASPYEMGAGRSWGARVAAQVLALRANDGSVAAVESQSPTFAPGRPPLR